MNYERTGILRVGGQRCGTPLHSPPEAQAPAPAAADAAAAGRGTGTGTGTTTSAIRPYQDRAIYLHGIPTDSVKVNPLSLGGKESFAGKLHKLLEEAEERGYDRVVRWQPHGRAFKVYDRKGFLNRVAPGHFNQSRFSSFQRQLNMYGFLRIRRPGDDFGCYYHEMFLRGKPALCSYMQRRSKKEAGPGYLPLTMEPNFYAMPYVHKKKSNSGNNDADRCPDEDEEPPPSVTTPRVLSTLESTVEPFAAERSSPETNAPNSTSPEERTSRSKSRSPFDNGNSGVGCSADEETSSLLLRRKRALDSTSKPILTARESTLQPQQPTAIMVHPAKTSTNHGATTIQDGCMDAPSEQRQHSSSCCSSPEPWPTSDDDSLLLLEQMQSVPAAADILKAINYCIDFDGQ